MPKSKSLGGMAIGCSLFPRRATHPATSKWHRSNLVMKPRSRNRRRRLWKANMKPWSIPECIADLGFITPAVAEIKKGTKINVVDEEKGWLKVESRRGNKPGYVEASIAKPVGKN